jgi:hypothetical protein
MRLPPRTPSLTSYTAAIADPDGRRIWSGPVSGTPPTLSADVPGGLLPAGDYEVTLRGAPDRDLATYYFRVLRR